MGILAERAQEILRKEKSRQEETEKYIENKFYREREAVTMAFENTFPHLIEMMKDEGIGWGVLPVSYDSAGLTDYFAPDFQIQFRPFKPYGKADDKVCLMDVTPGCPNHRDVEKRWESFKYRFSDTESYGQWSVDKIIVTLYRDLIKKLPIILLLSFLTISCGILGGHDDKLEPNPEPVYEVVTLEPEMKYGTFVLNWDSGNWGYIYKGINEGEPATFKGTITFKCENGGTNDRTGYTVIIRKKDKPNVREEPHLIRKDFDSCEVGRTITADISVKVDEVGTTTVNDYLADFPDNVIRVHVAARGWNMQIEEYDIVAVQEQQIN